MLRILKASLFIIALSYSFPTLADSFPVLAKATCKVEEFNITYTLGADGETASAKFLEVNSVYDLKLTSLEIDDKGIQFHSEGNSMVEIIMFNGDYLTKKKGKKEKKFGIC